MRCSARLRNRPFYNQRRDHTPLVSRQSEEENSNIGSRRTPSRRNPGSQQEREDAADVPRSDEDEGPLSISRERNAIEVPTMSNDKTQSPQFTQQAQPRTQQADSLDAQYKPIGISAVSAASALKPAKPKTPGPQMG